MSAPFIIPFNNNPSSTTIKTASYTIPAGKYAFVSSHVGNLSIDGSSVIPLQTLTFAITAGTSATVTRLNDFSIPNGIYITTATLTTTNNNYGGSFTFGLLAAPATDSVYTITSATRSTTGTTTNTVNSYFYGQNWYFSGTTTGSIAGGGTATTLVNFYPMQNFGAWVKSGTVLNGALYYVTEYNQIS